MNKCSGSGLLIIVENNVIQNEVYLFVIDNVSCGANLTGSSGIIQSPNYPSNYPDASNCEWTITVDSSAILKKSQIVPGTRKYLSLESKPQEEKKTGDNEIDPEHQVDTF